MLIGEDVLTMIRDFRICWIGGFNRSGKTALAERIGIEFIERGWVDRMVGNFPSVLHEDLDIAKCENAVIVLDEAGNWLNDKEFNKMTAFLGKRNLVVLLASTLPVVMRARTIQIQRTFNGYKFGLPYWRFTLNLDYMNLQDLVHLYWWRPDEVFRLYDTMYEARGEDGALLIKWVMAAYERKRAVVKPNTLVITGLDDERTTRDAGKLDWAGIQSMEDSGRVAQEIAESARHITNAVSAYKKIARKRK